MNGDPITERRNKRASDERGENGVFGFVGHAKSEVNDENFRWMDSSKNNFLERRFYEVIKNYQDTVYDCVDLPFEDGLVQHHVAFRKGIVCCR